MFSWGALASFGTSPTPASPSRATVDRQVARCVRVGRPADDSQRLAVTLIRGVAAIPAGRERAKECKARRAEIGHGIESVLQLLEAMEEALRSPGVLRAGAGGKPSPELLRHRRGLRGAASTTNALQTAARTLKTLDSFSTPELEYSDIAEQLSIIKEVIRDFTGVMLDACSTSVRRPEEAAEATALAPSDKLDALSDTCSTASGWMSRCASEASSEADCDNSCCSISDVTACLPAGACQALAAAPAPDEAYKARRPSASSSWTVPESLVEQFEAVRVGQIVDQYWA